MIEYVPYMKNSLYLTQILLTFWTWSDATQLKNSICFFYILRLSLIKFPSTLYFLELLCTKESYLHRVIATVKNCSAALSIHNHISNPLLSINWRMEVCWYCRELSSQWKWGYNTHNTPMILQWDKCFISLVPAGSFLQVNVKIPAAHNGNHRFKHLGNMSFRNTCIMYMLSSVVSKL